MTITGNCIVNAGPVTISGNLTVAPGASLAALFGQNDLTHSGNSNITVLGNMVVGQGASVMLWFATIRNVVRGNETVTGNVSTPDANEIVTNTVYGNLVCTGNNAAVQFGDSDGPANMVGGNATGECGFGVLLENPPPEVGVPNPPVLQHISVPLH